MLKYLNAIKRPPKLLSHPIFDYLTYIFKNKPQTFKEAMRTPKASFWREAINSEIESIMLNENHTWKLVDLSLGNKYLGYKWIFKMKLKVDRSIDKYKLKLILNKEKT